MACRNCKDGFNRDFPVEYVLHVHRAFLPQVFGSALDVACCPQIRSKFAGIVLRFSRQGNCIPFEKAAAIVDAAARGRFDAGSPHRSVGGVRGRVSGNLTPPLAAKCLKPGDIGISAASRCQESLHIHRVVNDEAPI